MGSETVDAQRLLQGPSSTPTPPHSGRRRHAPASRTPYSRSQRHRIRAVASTPVESSGTAYGGGGGGRGGGNRNLGWREDRGGLGGHHTRTRTWARLARMMARSFTPSSSLANAAEYSLTKVAGARQSGVGGWGNKSRGLKLGGSTTAPLCPPTPSSWRAGETHAGSTTTALQPSKLGYMQRVAARVGCEGA
jgi:hypothetical protein